LVNVNNKKPLRMLYIYEKDPTGGLCGFPADIPGVPSADIIRNELIRRNRIIKKIEKLIDIKIERIIIKNISQIDNQLVKELLSEKGKEAFPIFLYNNRIIYYGKFPDDMTLITQFKQEKLI